MPRVKRAVTAKARHNKVISRAKGYRGARKNVFRVANQAVMKADQYAYRDRRQRKRQFRTLWIVRINAAARIHDLSYSRLIDGLVAGQHRISSNFRSIGMSILMRSQGSEV